MSPLHHRGRRRLSPEAPVERLRGLLAEDMSDNASSQRWDHQDTDEIPCAEQDTQWRSPVRWKVPWAAVALAGLILVAVAVSMWWARHDSGEEPSQITASLSADMAHSGGMDAAMEQTAKPTTPETAFVHVVGEVHKPGVVAIPGTSRIQDAVEAAGGLTPDAVVDHVNLAEPVTDGAHIVIPDAEGDQKLAAGSVNSATSVPGNNSGQPPKASSAPSSSGLVNLNTATAAELETLPRVGPVMAQRIIDHRDSVGGFKSVEELDDVSGIGPAMLSSLTPLVTV